MDSKLQTAKDQIVAGVADLDAEIELETAHTSFTYTEPRAL
jgi:hypothetical protein